jgi:hypothetical protein
MAINNKEKQEEQQRQSLNRALLSVPGMSMLPELFARRMSREEQRARLLSTLHSALDITSDVDVSFFESLV